MATIYFEITEGSPPFTATLKEGGIEIQQKTGLGLGTHYFVNVPDGDYVIEIVSNIGCQIDISFLFNCTTTTTTFCDVYAEIVIPEIICPPTTSTTTSTSSSTTSTTSTTSSTSSTTTSTTTQNPNIKMCNEEFYAEGVEGYPDINGTPSKTILIGNGTGIVEFVPRTFNVPDRLIVKYDNVWKVDTGYISDVGDIYYGYEKDFRSLVVNALNGRIDPLSGLAYPITGAKLVTYAPYNISPNEIEPDGYPRIYMNQMLYTWNKLTTTPECKLYSFAPIGMTEWLVIMGCPGGVYFTSTTTSTTSSSTTTTTTTVLTGINTLFVKYDKL